MDDLEDFLLIFDDVVDDATPGVNARASEFLLAMRFAEKWEATNLAAGNPATAPTAAETTGTLAITCMIDWNRCGA